MGYLVALRAQDVMSTSEHVPVDLLTGEHSVISGPNNPQGDFHMGSFDDSIWICGRNPSCEPGGWSEEVGLRHFSRSF
jgi:hypothetical protein